MKGAKKSLSNLELQLVWDDDPNSDWYPWNSTFRSNELIHEYFEKNQMRKFIPPKFTWGVDHPLRELSPRSPTLNIDCKGQCVLCREERVSHKKANKLNYNVTVIVNKCP